MLLPIINSLYKGPSIYPLNESTEANGLDPPLNYASPAHLQ